MPTPNNCGERAEQSTRTIRPMTITQPPTGVRCFNETMDIKGTVTLDPGVYILDGVDLR